MIDRTSLDKFNVKLTPEGILICSETTSRQDNVVLQELCEVLGALLDFSDFLRVRARHATSLERALDEKEQAARRANFEAEALRTFELYQTKLEELHDFKAARAFVREQLHQSWGESQLLITEGRRIMKARQKGETKPKPHSRRKDRLEPSLKKHSRRSPELLEQKRQLTKAKEVVRQM